MKWEWENKVSLQRLLQKLKDADSSGAVLTKAESKFVYDLYEDKMKVLEKIRAEIEQNAYPIVHGVNSHELGMTLYGILQVIDKYLAEGSEKE